MEFKIASEPWLGMAILTELGGRLPQLEGNQLYLTSVAAYMVSIDYTRFLVSDNGLNLASSFGLLRLYEAPRLQKSVVCVEAVWFADDTAERQTEIWALMAVFAKNVGACGVCIHKNSVRTPSLLEELVQMGNVGGYSVERKHAYLLKSFGGEVTDGVYSAFCDRLTDLPFQTSCVRIYIGR